MREIHFRMRPSKIVVNNIVYHIKWQADKMTRWQADNLRNWHVLKMTNLTWHVDKIISSQNDKLTRMHVDM